MDLLIIIPIFIGVVFVIIIVTIIVAIVKGIAEWTSNNSKPVVSAPARIIAKRLETSGTVSSSSGGSVSTRYYITFQLPTGDRREFSLGGKAYGMLAEGDEGILTFQGTRYHGFERRLG